MYRGSDVEVSFDLDICIHIGECLRTLPAVFELRRRPWTLPDAAAADAVAKTVELCPSGALLYRRLDGGPEEQPPDVAQVIPMRNGPLLVKGRIEVRRGDGSVEVLLREPAVGVAPGQSAVFYQGEQVLGGARIA